MLSKYFEFWNSAAVRRRDGSLVNNRRITAGKKYVSQSSNHIDDIMVFFVLTLYVASA